MWNSTFLNIEDYLTTRTDSNARTGMFKNWSCEWDDKFLNTEDYLTTRTRLDWLDCSTSGVWLRWQRKDISDHAGLTMYQSVFRFCSCFILTLAYTQRIPIGEFTMCLVVVYLKIVKSLMKVCHLWLEMCVKRPQTQWGPTPTQQFLLHLLSVNYWCERALESFI